MPVPRNYHEFMESLERQREFFLGNGIHFFMHFTDNTLTAETLREMARKRSIELWTTNPIESCHLRFAVYAPENSATPHLPPEIAIPALIEGLRDGGLLSKNGYIWRLWYDRDTHPKLPHTIASVFIGWTL